MHKGKSEAQGNTVEEKKEQRKSTTQIKQVMEPIQLLSVGCRWLPSRGFPSPIKLRHLSLAPRLLCDLLCHPLTHSLPPYPLPLSHCLNLRLLRYARQVPPQGFAVAVASAWHSPVSSWGLPPTLVCSIHHQIREALLDRPPFLREHAPAHHCLLSVFCPHSAQHYIYS